MSGKRDIIIFAGTRVTSKKRRMFEYYVPSKKNPMLFSTKIIGISGIGTKLEVTLTEKGVSSPYKWKGILQPGEDNYDKVLEWSVEDRIAKEELNAISIARRGSENTIDDYIEKIILVLKARTKVDKARVARYIYEKIIKG